MRSRDRGELHGAGPQKSPRSVGHGLSWANPPNAPRGSGDRRREQPGHETMLVEKPGAPPRCRPGRRALWAREVPVVKKFLVVVLAVAAGFALWRKLESDKAEQALWSEVTDPVK